jgi:hypothetical protein
MGLLLLLSGAGRSLISVPSGFDYTPPVSIYKNGATSFSTNFNFNDYLVTPSVTYYFSPSGNDSNDGLSAGSPKKTFAALIVSLNSSPPSGATFNLAAGTYNGTDKLRSTINFPCNFICESGRAVMSNTTAASWSKTGGRTNVYEATIASEPCVTDATNVDSYGFDIRLRNVADVATCDITPNSMVYTGGVLYVHTFDSRAADASLSVHLGTFPYRQDTAQNLCFKNIDWLGTTNPVRWNYAGTSRVVLDSCRAMYATTSSGFESVDTSATAGLEIIYNNCTAAYNSLDGFSWRGATVGIEIGSKGVWNGYKRTGTSDNGTTIHNTAKVVRVAGDYRFNDDRCVHDINTSKGWFLGCTAGNPQNGSVGAFDNAAFLFGTSASSDQTLGWLEGCTSSGGAVTDLGSYGTNSIVRTKNCFGLNLVTGDGTVSTY